MQVLQLLPMLLDGFTSFGSQTDGRIGALAHKLLIELKEASLLQLGKVA
jgi:hypothetical protein